MVVLSQVLPGRAARRANVVVGLATVAYVWGAGALDLPHDVFFATLETVASLYAAWSAWRWRRWTTGPRASVRESASAARARA